MTAIGDVAKRFLMFFVFFYVPAMKVGTHRLFELPHCKELHRFNITHFGTDLSLPIHWITQKQGSASEFGR